MQAALDLYPYQVEGIHQLAVRRCVLLADDMGLGKTVQACVALKSLYERRAINRVLLICPTSLSRNWRRELGVWAPSIPAVLYEGPDRHGMLYGKAPVLIGSYETVAADLRGSTRDGASFVDLGVDLIVLDEAQRIKEPESVRSQVLGRILAPRRWAISGTPLENHPRELSSVLRFLFPNEFLSPDSISDFELVLRLRDRCMVRRTKSEVGMQLPSRTEAYIPVRLTPDQDSEYQLELTALRQTLTSNGDSAEVNGLLLGGLQSLRRITTISKNGSSAKLDFIGDELQTLSEQREKIVIFSSFAELALPAAFERLKPFHPVLFTGAMTQKEKDAAHRKFCEDPECLVMCASIRAAGVGITWTVARFVYHLDLWWNPQVIRQADDRVHRIGQERPVFLKKLVAEHTIDESICCLLTSKEEVFDFVIEGEHQMQAGDGRRRDRLLQMIGLPESHSAKHRSKS